MKVYNFDIYIENGKYYCLECNSQILVHGHVKGCSRKDSGEIKVSNPIMQFFDPSHLSGKKYSISSYCADLAETMNTQLPDGPEKSAGLRKLLEAKDCFVRATMQKMESE